MEILAHPVVAVILLLGILIFVHEAGHFFVGKLCGIGVEIFSIGVGPSILKIRYKETEYKIGMIPLGGYVKFFGTIRTEEVPEELSEKAYYKASPTKRMITVFSGPFANFLLAVLIYMVMGMRGIPQPPPVVGEVMAGSPAEQAGLKFGDIVKSINGIEIRTWSDLQEKIAESPNKNLRLSIIRGGDILDLNIMPKIYSGDELAIFKSRGRIGISPGRMPAVISLLDTEGVAARAGFKTGDRIENILIGEKKQPVKYWWDFLAVLAEISASKNSQILKMEVSEKVSVEEKSAQKQKTVALDLSNIKPEDRVPMKIAQILGITHSGLTIGSVRKEIKKSSTDKGGFDSSGDELSRDDNNSNQEMTEEQILKQNYGKAFDLLMYGDRIVKWNGENIPDIFKYTDIVMAYGSPSAVLQVQREGRYLDLNIDLEPVIVQKAEGKVIQYILPVEFIGSLVQGDMIIEKYSFPEALWFGTVKTVQQTKLIAEAVIGLFTGDVPLMALGGPISIGKVASDSVRLGWMTFFSALALISVNLGLLNLFPIPVLDGGQLILLSLEVAYRKPLPEIAVENFQKVGFIMVLGLVVMATYNDLSRFWSSMLEGVSGFFR
ncbi:MAG: RIP metalloprotease RseP [Oligoflexales bacterium]|nr:RIP metalloprotease RseP [Oligoflexales bacterium]